MAAGLASRSRLSPHSFASHGFPWFAVSFSCPPPEARRPQPGPALPPGAGALSTKAIISGFPYNSSLFSVLFKISYQGSCHILPHLSAFFTRRRKTGTAPAVPAPYIAPRRLRGPRTAARRPGPARPGGRRSPQPGPGPRGPDRAPAPSPPAATKDRGPPPPPPG